ncbi:MAG: YfiT family bacillithiol transferase [Terriglobales bacterium]
MTQPLDRQYPIGRFQRPAAFSPESRRAAIQVLAALPAELQSLVGAASPSQLEQRYRQGGWTIRELAHHVADSHLNAYIRMKMALTETNPAIFVYNEALWAKLPDVTAAPPSVSLHLLDALHQRWIALLRQLSEADFQRCYQHPEQGLVPLDACLALYAWHSRHHAAHIRLALTSPA